MIGGTQSRTLRENEGLPPGCRAAHTLLDPFKKAGYWRGEGTSGGDFTTFMLVFAIVIKRPIIVFERQGGCILTPIKVYGARNTATGACCSRNLATRRMQSSWLSHCTPWKTSST